MQLKYKNYIYPLHCQGDHMPCESLQMCSKTASVWTLWPPTTLGRVRLKRCRRLCPTQEVAVCSTLLRQGQDIAVLLEGEGGEKAVSLWDELKSPPVATGFSLGVRLSLRPLEEDMCWKTLLLLLLYYNAQATVSHRWSRGELLFIPFDSFDILLL